MVWKKEVGGLEGGGGKVDGGGKMKRCVKRILFKETKTKRKYSEK
jgi:hypothetical protein